ILSTSKDGPVEEMRGIAVDIARELAKQLGVAFEPVRYKAVNQLLEGAKAGEWDVAFIGLDPTRTADMDFTAAYLDVGNTYLVLANSPIQNIGDADRPGHRIAVTRDATQDLFLSKNLKQAEVIRVPLIQTSGLELLTSGKAHALTENTQVPSSNWLRKYLAPQSSKAAFTVHRKLSQSLKEGQPAVLREGVYRTRKGQRTVGAVDPASQFARRDCCAPF